MRWQIREAKIDSELRKTFEQYGVQVMQQILSVGSNFRHQGRVEWVETHRDALLEWLTEKHDIQERKERVSFVMEAAIVVLVAAELFFSIANFVWNKCGQ